MPLSHSDTWENFEAILYANNGVQSSWNKLIGYLESVVDKPYWDELRGLDVVYEQTEIKDWLESLLKESPLQPDIIAFWFGIFESVIGEAKPPMYTIYLIGADNYDAEDNSWAMDCKYDPTNKYLIPDVLAEVVEIIEQDEEEFGLLNWILPLAYFAFVLEEILTEQIDEKLLLKYQPKIFATVGYDSGDYINLSPIEE